ncbi:MAG TPA: hypothetical protein ENN19_03955 [Chloroflexi bacterium]|nr:hypothetical protein [Chloroflexota bacterium]
MNTLNRVVLVIFLLLSIVVCTLTLVAPLPVLALVVDQGEGVLNFLERLQWYVRVPVGIVIALILDTIFVLLIFLEVRKPSRKSIQVEKTEGGEVQISVASIADRLHYEVDQLPGVLRVMPKVSGKRGGVVVELDVETSAKISVPDKSAEILDVAREVVEDKMGLKLAQPPRVNLRSMPYPKTTKKSIEKRERAAEEEMQPVETSVVNENEEDLFDF